MDALIAAGMQGRAAEALAARAYGPDELAEALIRLMDGECPHLPEVTALFLARGMDANAAVKGCPLLERAFFACADTVRILLEHGAQLTAVSSEGCTVFQTLDDEIVFAAVEQEDRDILDRRLHAWLVLVGFGSRLRDGGAPLQPAAGYDLADFRDHGRFDCRVMPDPVAREGWTLIVTDRTTGREAARL